MKSDSVNPASPGAPFERLIEILPAFDSDPHKDYGIHGVEMRFVLKGPRGAVSFLLYTNWQLPHVTRETDERTAAKALAGGDIAVALRCLYHPIPADRGYHSPVPLYEGQRALGPCPYLDGAPCYYDGSSLNARVVFEALLREGGEGVWKELEYYYRSALETPIAERTIESVELGVLLEAMSGGLKSPNAEPSPLPPSAAQQNDVTGTADGPIYDSAEVSNG
jgi:hypothetical protein